MSVNQLSCDTSHAACQHQGWDASFEAEHWIWKKTKTKTKQVPIPVAQGHAEYHLMLLDFSLFFCVWKRDEAGPHWITVLGLGFIEILNMNEVLGKYTNTRDSHLKQWRLIYIHSVYPTRRGSTTHQRGHAYHIPTLCWIKVLVYVCALTSFNCFMLQRNTNSFVNRAMDS